MQPQRNSGADLIKVRVTCPQYGRQNPAFKGDIIEVTRHEMEMNRVAIVDGNGSPTGKYEYPALMPLEVEQAQVKEQIEPDRDQKLVDIQRRRTAALAEQEAEREKQLGKLDQGKAVADLIEANTALMGEMKDLLKQQGELIKALLAKK